ncbi:DUF6286 domain-containing protein [Ruania suaedae]|uniref:DUF6286 domain-containing protein n=1 Tax=Ruania suaedae TaxID=2897774 RepID=UPI001E43CDB9|nr:DUF6286 domain-containing protein [Ruania suaedae]UFU03140.1 DUF6286 domain-containing protein [Ruania suaedae]
MTATPAAPAESALAAARARTGRTGLRVATVVVAVLLAAIAALLGQHALVDWGRMAGTSWLRSGAEFVAGDDPSALIGAGAAVLLGLVIMAAAWPRRQRVHRLRSAPALHLHPVDVARLASTTARRVDGVLSATTTVSGRRVDIRITATGTDRVAEDVLSAVRAALALLDGSFRVRPHVRTPGGRGGAS